MRGTLFAVVFACAVVGLVASDAHGNVSGMDVTVSDAAGRPVYRGKTDAAGAFGTGRVAPGVYVVQLNAKKVALDRNDYGIFAAGGTHRVVADAVEGAKFASGGVAMRLKLKTATPIIGQVALGTKIVDGTRYILMAPQTGSNIGPRWVEEGTPPLETSPVCGPTLQTSFIRSSHILRVTSSSCVRRMAGHFAGRL
jgi:hypothetical protein